MSTDQSLNLLSKACNQWIAKVYKKKDTKASYMYQISNYKGVLLFESREFAQKADCLDDIWRLRDEILTYKIDTILNNKKLTNKLLKGSKAFYGILAKRRLRNTKEVEIISPSTATKAQKHVRTKTLKNGKKIQYFSNNLFSKATIHRDSLKVEGREIYAQSNKLFGTLQGTKKDESLLKDFINILCEKGQIIQIEKNDEGEDSIVKDFYSKSYFSSISPDIINYMFSLDGRAPNSDENPTSYRQWENDNSIFEKNSKLKNFFTKYIVGDN